MTNHVTSCDGLAPAEKNCSPRLKIDAVPLDGKSGDLRIITGTDAGLPDLAPMPCGSFPPQPPKISSKIGWGGRRANSGGLRENSGGARPGAGRKRRELKHPDPITPLAGLSWYCVRTAFHQELELDLALRRRGFTVYLPAFLREAERDRKGHIKAGAYDKIVPLFPRYLFVQFDVAEPAWRQIPSIPLVERLFSSTPERPTPVPQQAIEALLRECAPNGVIYPNEAAHKVFDAIEPGTELEILNGPFSSFRAVCLLSERKRLRVLASIFGRTTEVELRPADVRRV